MSADCVELERKLAEARDLAVALGRELAAARDEHCDSDCACREAMEAEWVLCASTWVEAAKIMAAIRDDPRPSIYADEHIARGLEVAEKRGRAAGLREAAFVSDPEECERYSPGRDINEALERRAEEVERS